MKKIIVFFLFLAVSAPCFAETYIISEKGRHGPITFAITISPEGNVEDIAIQESNEVKGANIAKKRFLRQFIGKSSKDPIRLRRDVDAVTGATVSSAAAARAVRRALAIWEESR